MGIDEKKKEVLAFLSNKNDSSIIEKVYDILQRSLISNEVKIEQLPDALQRKIARAMEDYSTGNYFTHEAMKDKVAAWLT